VVLQKDQPSRKLSPTALKRTITAYRVRKGGSECLGEGYKSLSSVEKKAVPGKRLKERGGEEYITRKGGPLRRGLKWGFTL